MSVLPGKPAASTARSGMRLLSLLVVLGWATAGKAQEDLNVLTADQAGVSPRKMLYSYLQAEAQKHFEARRQAVAALKTPEDVRRRQQDLKAKFLDALGGFPARTPLNATVLGKEQRDGYHVERIIYESRPNHQ